MTRLWENQKVYKVLAEDGRPAHGGTGTWPLPTVDRLGRRRPGRWWKVEGDIVACANGLHLVPAATMGQWVDNAAARFVYEAEWDGEVDDRSQGKIAVRRARLLRFIGEVTPEVLKDIKDNFMYWDEGRVANHIVTGTEMIRYFETPDRLRPDPSKLVFGVHRIPAREAEGAPAWPSFSTIRKRANARWKNMLKRTARELELARMWEVAP